MKLINRSKLASRAIGALILAVVIALWMFPAAVNAQSNQTLLAQVEDAAPIPTRIQDIQGTAHRSLREGENVSEVPGIVTAVRPKSFYMQDTEPDADDRTSQGIVVFTKSVSTVKVGDSVLVSGTVKEFRPGKAEDANLTVTEIVEPTVTVLSSNNELPAATLIGVGGRIAPTQIIEDDAIDGNPEDPGTVFDPEQDGLDFYESLEGMLVQVNNPVVVGPTNVRGETFILADGGTSATGRTTRGGIAISVNDFNPERIEIDDELIKDETPSPKAQVGDRFDTVVGVLDYSDGNFKIFATSPLNVVPGKLTAEKTKLVGSKNQLTIASFNVENLDPGDVNDRGENRFERLASVITDNLKSPDIIGLVEIQDNNGSKKDGIVDADVTYKTLIEVIRNAGGPTYDFVDIAPVDDKDGGEPGGNIRVGFIFRPDRVTLAKGSKGTATEATTVVKSPGGADLSFNPGRIDPTNPAFEASRKPLVAEFLFNRQKVFVIANHFNSKGGDNPLFGSIQPPKLESEVQRIEQAKVVNQFVDELLKANPNANVVVLGDLNDFEFSKPLVALKDDVLEDLVEQLPRSDRYTYIFQGNSQVLDHILVSKHLSTAAPKLDIVHLNPEFKDPVSDHEPLVARLKLSARTGKVLGEGSGSGTALFPGEKGQSLLKKLAAKYAPTGKLSYGDARDLLYGKIDNTNNVVTDIYTGYQITLNPNAVPRNDAAAKGINAEHIWPQSLGASGDAKSDLHNLFPARIRVNSARSNFPFTEIDDSQSDKWFRLAEESSTMPTQFIDEYSELDSTRDSKRFEPREAKKGDVARAMFYFATIYNKADSGFFQGQKNTLCQWNKKDPINAAEVARSHAIASSPQGNENPFVLDSTLAERTYCAVK